MTQIQVVIDRLSEIIEESKKDNSPLGYFAALYRKVTIRIRDGIAKNEFEDNERMERLDVLFAQRYLDAYNNYKSGKTPTQSWHLAFLASSNKKNILLQHLLLGINAHINLDLGIAAVETVGNAPLRTLKADFDAINAILGEMVDEVQDSIGKVSPLFKILDPLTGNTDEYIANFSINIARDGAWQFADDLYNAQSKDRERIIKDRDFAISVIAENLASPKGKWLNTVISFIRWFETKSVSRVIGFLAAD